MPAGADWLLEAFLCGFVLFGWEFAAGSVGAWSGVVPWLPVADPSPWTSSETGRLVMDPIFYRDMVLLPSTAKPRAVAGDDGIPHRKGLEKIPAVTGRGDGFSEGLCPHR